MLAKKLFLYIVITLAFLERVFLDFGVNIELITLSAILSYLILGKRKSILITFSLLALTDLFVGNTNIFLFTWSGFLLPIFFYEFAKSKTKVISGTIYGLLFSLFFFFWTNFGVWYLDRWGMYADDLSGLVSSYINGLPFFKLSVINVLITVPPAIWISENIDKLPVWSRKQKSDKIINPQASISQ